MTSSRVGSWRPRVCGWNNLITLRSWRLPCTYNKIALHGTIKAVIWVFLHKLASRNLGNVLFIVPLHLMRVNSILSLAYDGELHSDCNCEVFNLVFHDLGCAWCDSTQSGDEAKKICRTWCDKRWRDSVRWFHRVTLKQCWEVWLRIMQINRWHLKWLVPICCCLDRVSHCRR